MSREVRAHQDKIGIDKWSDRHPILRRRSRARWKRVTVRTWRRILKIRDALRGEEA